MGRDLPAEPRPSSNAPFSPLASLPSHHPVSAYIPVETAGSLSPEEASLFPESCVVKTAGFEPENSMIATKQQIIQQGKQ